METRRDTAENLLRQRVLELELKLLKAENLMSLVVAWGGIVAGFFWHWRRMAFFKDFSRNVYQQTGASKHVSLLPF